MHMKLRLKNPLQKLLKMQDFKNSKKLKKRNARKSKNEFKSLNLKNLSQNRIKRSKLKNELSKKQHSVEIRSINLS